MRCRTDQPTGSTFDVKVLRKFGGVFDVVARDVHIKHAASTASHVQIERGAAQQGRRNAVAAEHRFQLKRAISRCIIGERRSRSDLGQNSSIHGSVLETDVDRGLRSPSDR